MKWLRYQYNLLFIVNKKHTTIVGNTWKLSIKKPSEKKLYKCGFRNANRGYRYKCRRQISIHVLPTGQGWEVHIDRMKGGEHSVSKNFYANMYLKRFLKYYPII